MGKEEEEKFCCVKNSASECRNDECSKCYRLRHTKENSSVRQKRSSFLPGCKKDGAKRDKQTFYRHLIDQNALQSDVSNISCYNMWWIYLGKQS